MINRRCFIRDTAIAALSASAGGAATSNASDSGSASTDDAISFFVVGDTHYCVDANNPKTLASNSAQYNSQLVQQLNQLCWSIMWMCTGIRPSCPTPRCFKMSGTTGTPLRSTKQSNLIGLQLPFADTPMFERSRAGMEPRTIELPMVYHFLIQTTQRISRIQPKRFSM